MFLFSVFCFMFYVFCFMSAGSFWGFSLIPSENEVSNHKELVGSAHPTHCFC